MTTIQHFPEEILSIIFKSLLTSQLKQCQIVCRAWYRPAHISSLIAVQLRKSVDIERFITSIDHNPDSQYINAVREIKIQGRGDVPSHFLFDKTTLHKLFFRFPRLESVIINNKSSFLFQDFDDELCQAFLQSCPKLEYFEVNDNDSDGYYDTIYKVRLLVTNFFLGFNIGSIISRYGSLSTYLSCFPRLRMIRSYSEHIQSFESMLPVLQQAPNLSDFPMGSTLDDEEGFAERYLAKKTPQEQQALIETLSNITDLNYMNARAFFVSIPFDSSPDTSLA